MRFVEVFGPLTEMNLENYMFKVSCISNDIVVLLKIYIFLSIY